MARLKPLSPLVAQALIIYIQCEALGWRDVNRLDRGLLDVALREFSPADTDAYHNWRLAWMQNKNVVHPNPGLDWSF